MQNGGVGLERELPQYGLFLGIGIREQGQRRVSMGGEDHLIEAFRSMAVGLDGHAVFAAADGAHGRTGPDPGAERG